MLLRSILLAVLLLPAAVYSQTAPVPTPRAHFGFDLGEDRKLADWQELTSYFERLARGSQRVRVDTLGTSTLGLPFVMVTVTSAENLARLDELRGIQERLSDPRTIRNDAELQRLLDQGKTVVLITHGIHATEVGGPLMAPRLLHRLATANDPRTREILDNVILLDIPSLNPDGLQWVVDWYERWLGTPFEGAPLPWLYHYYTGHDNNRDWYAFTQVETQHTITRAHNVWHPQIVHDIHQMGSSGARIFFPPYIDPFEPNVDPGLIAAVNQLGAYMAAELVAEGKTGVVINAQYDGFTPARAYQHYHGGARILSETASVRIATPIELSDDQVRGGRGFDASVPSWNFPWPWEAGPWTLGDIVDYMESGAFALLTNAARNRRYWLENFHEINTRAVEKWDRWPEAWVIPANQGNPAGLAYVLRILTMGDVEVHRSEGPFRAGGRELPAGTYVIPMRQPYASFAQAMLEIQEYPDLREYPGGPPQRPYDVTAHTLGLLMDVDYFPMTDSPSVALSEPIGVPEWDFRLPSDLEGEGAPRVGIYRSWQEPMPEGWTRWTFDKHGLVYDTIRDARIRAGRLTDEFDVILLQDQSPGSILNGFSAEQVPGEYAGGIGEEGAQALRTFVRNGGRLVAIEEATELVIELFDLKISNAVDRLPPRDFYVPGSILGVDLDPEHSLTRGKGERTSVWFGTHSRAFEVLDPQVEVVARFQEGSPLLSGWLLGPQHLAGKPALVEAKVGEGTVVLFGFQPDYRAQTVATWPLLFNALAGEG